MLEFIINTIFSIPYLGFGLFIITIFDIFIFFTKTNTRFTLIEILGGVMFWPIVLVVVFTILIKGQN